MVLLVLLYDTMLLILLLLLTSVLLRRLFLVGMLLVPLFVLIVLLMLFVLLQDSIMLLELHMLLLLRLLSFADDRPLATPSVILDNISASEAPPIFNSPHECEGTRGSLGSSPKRITPEWLLPTIVSSPPIPPAPPLDDAPPWAPNEPLSSPKEEELRADFSTKNPKSMVLLLGLPKMRGEDEEFFLLLFPNHTIPVPTTRRVKPTPKPTTTPTYTWWAAVGDTRATVDDGEPVDTGASVSGAGWRWLAGSSGCQTSSSEHEHGSAGQT
jgi:hypothetical protein